jgi:catechol 2,3-dioxygenase-like lactoylglutathione lyase family enzyme
MSRVQLALRVADLEGSIAFYSKLFGAEPAKLRPGYANFAISEPPLKLVLIEGAEGEPTRMDHLGVEVETTEEVTAATTRLAAEGLATSTEKDTACCYAVQDKVWVAGPGARALGGLRRQGRRRIPRQGCRLDVLRSGRRTGSPGRHPAVRLLLEPQARYRDPPSCPQDSWGQDGGPSLHNPGGTAKSLTWPSRTPRSHLPSIAIAVSASSSRPASARARSHPPARSSSRSAPIAWMRVRIRVSLGAMIRRRSGCGIPPSRVSTPWGKSAA